MPVGWRCWPQAFCPEALPAPVYPTLSLEEVLVLLHPPGQLGACLEALRRWVSQLRASMATIPRPAWPSHLRLPGKCVYGRKRGEGI